MSIPLDEVPTGYGSRKCPVCQRPLLCTPYSERCEQGHYAHVTMPRPALGELFGVGGQPWGQLRNPHAHSNPVPNDRLER